MTGHKLNSKKVKKKDRSDINRFSRDLNICSQRK